MADLTFPFPAELLQLPPPYDSSSDSGAEGGEKKHLRRMSGSANPGFRQSSKVAVVFHEYRDIAEFPLQPGWSIKTPPSGLMVTIKRVTAGPVDRAAETPSDGSRSAEPPGKLLSSPAEQFHGIRTGIPGRPPQDSPVQNTRFPVKHGRNQLGSAGFKAKNRFIHYSIRTNQSPPVPSLKLPSFQADSLTLAGSSRQKDTPGQRK